ncbi:MAG: PilZ domain-containing protein [Myxococcota bacterium]|nr:PilZ domain-containing protein [Myxococcota bacterium]
MPKRDGDELPKGIMGERRRASRVPVDLDCQCVTDEDFFLLGERVVDLTPQGLLLRANGVAAKLGETVVVSFKPPRSQVWIDAEATVVRLVTGSRPGAPGIGLALKDLSPFETGLLEAALERQRQPSPRRERPTFRRARWVPEDAVKASSIVRLTAGAKAAASSDAAPCVRPVVVVK